MHLTEKQAALVWCPMVRVLRFRLVAPPDCTSTAVGAAVNLPEKDVALPACIGSKCAMWRWDETFKRASNGERLGFCGLAGRPDL